MKDEKSRPLEGLQTPPAISVSAMIHESVISCNIQKTCHSEYSTASQRIAVSHSVASPLQAARERTLIPVPIFHLNKAGTPFLAAKNTLLYFVSVSKRPLVFLIICQLTFGRDQDAHSEK